MTIAAAPKYHLAELNIALLRAPLTDPLIADFVGGLNRINTLAENSPGFVWRLKDEAGNATSFNPFNNPLLIINLSVWQSVEALYTYTYSSDHTDFFRRRVAWFERLETPSFVLWWVPVGVLPTLNEAKERLERLTLEGATPAAFTFKKQFAPQPV